MIETLLKFGFLLSWRTNRVQTHVEVHLRRQQCGHGFQLSPELTLTSCEILAKSVTEWN